MGMTATDGGGARCGTCKDTKQVRIGSARGRQFEPCPECAVPAPEGEPGVDGVWDGQSGERLDGEGAGSVDTPKALSREEVEASLALAISMWAAGYEKDDRTMMGAATIAKNRVLDTDAALRATIDRLTQDLQNERARAEHWKALHMGVPDGD